MTMPIFNRDRVTLRERLRLQREVNQSIREKMKAGKSPDDAVEEVLAEASAKYGASPDWSAILEAITKILELLFSFFNADNQGVETPPADGMNAVAPPELPMPPSEPEAQPPKKHGK